MINNICRTKKNFTVFVWVHCYWALLFYLIISFTPGKFIKRRKKICASHNKSCLSQLKQVISRPQGVRKHSKSWPLGLLCQPWTELHNLLYLLILKTKTDYTKPCLMSQPAQQKDWGRITECFIAQALDPPFLIMWPWVRYLTSTCFSFFIWKGGGWGDTDNNIS